MNTKNTQNNILVPTSEIITRAKARGVNFGKGRTNNRIRYYTKIGLLPHAIRKETAQARLARQQVQAQGTLPPRTEGHYPLWVVDTLVAIDEKIKKGVSVQKIIRENDNEKTAEGGVAPTDHVDVKAQPIEPFPSVVSQAIFEALKPSTPETSVSSKSYTLGAYSLKQREDVDQSGNIIVPEEYNELPRSKLTGYPNGSSSSASSSQQAATYSKPQNKEPIKNEPPKETPSFLTPTETVPIPPVSKNRQVFSFRPQKLHLFPAAVKRKVAYQSALFSSVAMILLLLGMFTNNSLLHDPLGINKHSFSLHNRFAGIFGFITGDKPIAVQEGEPSLTFSPVAKPSGSVLAERTPNLDIVTINADTEIIGKLTAPNIIYDLVAGTNIQITEGQTPTISASFTEADTLATVTARGATTSTALTLTGGLTTTTLAASGITNSGATSLTGTVTLSNTLNLGSLTSDPSSASNGMTYYNSSTNKFRCYQNGSWNNCLITDTNSGGTMSSFTLAGDSGTSQTISDGNTLTVVGGTNIASVASATDTITLNLDDSITLAGDIAVNGDDITSDGNLTLAATGYVRIGDSGTPGSASGDDDLYVEGDLEVDTAFILGSDSITDITGNGLSVSSSALTVNLLTAVDGTGSTSSNSGLEFQGSSSNQLALIQGCSDTQLLTWDDTNSLWQCGSVSGVGGVTGTGASGRVTFWTGTSTIDDSANFLWDNTNSNFSVASGNATGATTSSGVSLTATSLTTGTGLYVATTSTPTSASSTSNGITMALTQAAATNATTYTGLALNFTNNPTVSANTENVFRIQNQATTNTTDNTVNSLLLLDNADTSTPGSTVITDALRITNTGDISGGITNAINIDDTDITTDIVLQNDETIDNNTDGTILLTAATTSLSGDLTIQGGDITGANSAALDIGEATSGAITFTAASTGDYVFTIDSDSNITSTGGADGTDVISIPAGDILLSDGDLDLSGGDFNVTLDAGDGVNIAKGAAPTVDVFTINGSTSTTTGVDGLQLTFGASNASGNVIDITPSYAGGATDALTYSIIDIDAFSPTNAAGTDTVNALAIGNLTDPGATITSTALNIGSGFDNELYFEKGSNDLQFRVTAPTGATRTLTVPALSADVDLCHSGGNCAGSGTGVTASPSGADNQIAFFTAAQNITSEADFGWDDTNNLFTVVGASGQTTQTVAAISSTAQGVTSGGLLSASLTQSAATGTSVSGDITNFSFSPTYSTAVTTPAISGNVLDISRSATTNASFASTLTVSGAVATISDNCTQTTGTCTNTANVLSLTQSYSAASGALLNLSNAGTGADIAFNTSPILTVGNTGTLTVTDGTNTLFSIADDTSEGDVTVTGDLAVNGATSADITTSTTTATVFNATATTLSLGGGATTALNIGNGASAYTAINIGSGAGGNTIHLAGTGATGADTINIGTGGTGADTITIGSTASTTSLALTAGTGDITLSTTDDIFGYSTQTSGNILTLGVNSAVTVAGSATALVGARIDLAANYTTADDDTTGLVIVLDDTTDADATVDDLTGIEISGGTVTVNGTSAVPIWEGVEVTLPIATTTTGTSATFRGIDVVTQADTQSTTLTTTYVGFDLSSAGALTQDTAAGTINFRGANITMPNITQTTGTINAAGVLITNGTITTGGTQNMISLSAAGVGAGTLNGINIGNITAGAGTETAIVIGSGWDNEIYFEKGTNDLQFRVTAPTGATRTITVPALAADADFCFTTGNCAGSGTGVTTAGGTANTLAKFTAAQAIGNASITDDGTTVTLSTDNAFTLAGSENIEVTNTTASTDQLSLSATGITTDAVEALSVALTQADDADATDTNAGIQIALTSSSGDADLLYGINIANITGGANPTETAQRIGSGFDNLFEFEGSTDNGVELFIRASDPTTSDKIITFPDDTGTVCLSSGNCAGGAGGSKWTDGGAVTYLTSQTDNLAVGGTDSTSEFFIDIANGGNVALTSTADTETVLSATSTAFTTGELFDLTGTWAPTDGSTNEAIDINITHSNTTLADNFQSINLTTTDGTALGNTVYNVQGTLTLTGNVAKTGIGDYQTVTSSSTTGDTLVAFDAASTVTGIIGGATTRNVYGLRSQPTAGAESTAGTTNLYGAYINATGDVGVGGTFNAYGAYIANGTYDTDGTSTATGLYVETISGADTNYTAIFAGGNVGIGDTTPGATLEVGNGTDTLQISSVGDITFVDADGAASITGPAGGALSVLAGASQALTLTGAGASTWSTSNGLLTVSGDDGLTLTASTTAGITGNFPDNITNALDIQESTNNYININTTNASENISFGNATTNPSFSFLGTGAVTIAGSADGTDALVLTAGDILVTNGDLDLSGGDFNVTLDAGDGVNISKGAAPTVDVFTINGSTSTLDGVDNLQLTFGVSNASGNVIDITPSYSDTAAVSTSEDYYIIDIDAFTATQNAAGDTGGIRGLNIGALTQTETAGTITASAIRVGTGWDDVLNYNGTTVINGTGQVVSTQITGTLFSITDSSTTETIVQSNTITFADSSTVNAAVSATDTVTHNVIANSLDFAHFENTLDVDAATDINLGAFALTVDLDSTGDFSIRDVTTDIATFADTGVITFAPTSGEDVILNFAGNGRLDINPVTYETALGAVDVVRTGAFTGTAAETANEIRVAPSLTLTEPGSGTFTWYGANIDMSGILVTAGVGTTALTSLRVAGVSDADAGTVTGIDIANITATAATENALTIGTGWDTDINFADTSPTVVVANTGTITVTDGTNTLFSIADDTAEGDVTVTGDLAVNGATSADITSATTTATLFNATVTTLDIGGAATTLNLADAAVTGTIDIGGVTANGATTVNIATNSTTADTITIGNTGGATSLALSAGTGDITLSTSDDIFGYSTQTSGNIFTLGANSAVTLAGLVTAANIDLSTNYTATNQSQTGLDILLDGQTNTDTSGTDAYKGIEISGTALTQNGAGGTTAFEGVEITIPAITGTAGTITADGIEITIPASAAITTAGTMNGIEIIAPTTSGPAAGTLNGLNIAALTSAGAATEYALVIGSGWDRAISATGTIALTSLASCDTIDTDSSGILSCGTDAGGSSTLQGAYNADVDGGDAIISLLAADDSLIFRNPSSLGTDSAFLLFLDQLHTTAAVSVLDITQASNAADAVNLTANSIDTENALDIAANGLTTGTALNVTSTGTIVTTGEVLSVTGNSATTGAVARLSGTGLTTGVGLEVTGGSSLTTGNLLSLASSSYAHGASETGNVTAISFTDATLLNAAATTTTSGLNIASTVNVTGGVSSSGTKTINALNVASPTLTACSGGTNACVWNGVQITAPATTSNITSTALKIVADSLTTDTAESISGNALTTGRGISITSTSTGLTSGSLFYASSATTGAVATNGIISLQATGNYTSTSNIGLLTVLADSTAAGTIQRISGNALTTGDALSIASTGTGLTSGSLLTVSSATTGAVATDGIVSLNATGNYTSTSNIGLLSVKADATAAGTIANISGDALTTGVGLLIDNGTSAMTTGSLLRVSAGGTGAIATNGLVNFAHSGVYTSTANVGFVNVAANSTTAGTVASIYGDGLTTGTGLYTSFDALTTGRGFDITSTSTALTSGNIFNLDWSPGSATTATGDLMRINIGTNGTTTGNLFDIEDTASSIFSVSEVQFSSSLPANFTSPGDVAIAYDINFTNPTASYITSAAPMYLRAGETFNSSDLTLQTYNSGQIVFDSPINGAQVISDTTSTATGTVTVSGRGVVYYLNDSSGTTNTSYTTTINVTGVPNVDGTIVFMRTSCQKGVTAGSQTHTCAIQLNGSAINTVATAAGTGASTVSESYIAARVNASWRILTGTSTSDTADLAEWMQFVGEKPQAGEAVAISGTALSVIKATRAYDSKVIGIVSTNPHTVMGTETPDSVAVALAGRVPAKVSTENGPIAKGDYLTSSTTPGVAVKATKPGPTIGKALEDFTGSGIGTVEVFVNLSYADPGNALANLAIDGSGNLRVTSLTAGVEVLAGKLTADEIATTKIVGQDNKPITVVLGENGSWHVVNAKGQTAFSLDENGNATFSGELVARSIRAGRIEGIEILTNRLSALEASSSSPLSPQSPFSPLLDDQQEATVSGGIAGIATNSATGNPEKVWRISKLGDATFSSVKSLISLIAPIAHIGQLKVSEDATIGNGLKVLGGTVQLPQTNVAGSLTVGTVTINDLVSSIDSLSGDLKLQYFSQGGVDFIAGKVVIDPQGNVTIASGDLNIDQGIIVGNGNIRGVNVPVENGSSFMRVSLPTPRPTNNYAVSVTPAWLTNTAVIQKSQSEFIVEFSENAPAGASLDWIIID